MKVLLDSVILIDHFNGIAAATRYLSKIHADAVTSVVSRAGVLAGLQGRHGLKLATRDRRDFPPARHRFVVIPYDA